MKCRFSHKKIPSLLSFGKMPLGNGFIDDNDLSKDEFLYDMNIAVNSEIGLIQLENQPLPSEMFHDQYAFFSRTSNFMKSHFKDVAQEITHILQEEFPSDFDPFIVEIGSNDGVMLEHLVKEKVNCLGVEPSINVAKESNKYGVKTLNKFFSSDLSEEIKKEHAPANIIYAANVFCHIPDINDLAKACSNLLNDNGILIFEDPYLGDVLEKTSFDQIYDEHVFLFSCHSINQIFSNCGLQLYDCKKIPTHGGSMRYYLSKNQNVNITDALNKQFNHEVNIGLLNLNEYQSFAKKCEFVKTEFKKRLVYFKEEKKKIVGYGATSKSTTILNYCDIGPDLIDFIVDTTPSKIGKFSPGKRIPILDYSRFIPHPDVSVLFAWNHKKEIMEKEKSFKGIWITHLYDELKKII